MSIPYALPLTYVNSDLFDSLLLTPVILLLIAHYLQTFMIIVSCIFSLYMCVTEARQPSISQHIVQSVTVYVRNITNLTTNTYG